MPRDFKEFSKTSNNFRETENETKTQQNPNKTQDFQEIIDKYKDMDQNSLMSSLLTEASRLKKEGKLDSEALNKMEISLKPFLNIEQQKMLDTLVNAINGQ